MKNLVTLCCVFLAISAARASEPNTSFNSRYSTLADNTQLEGKQYQLSIAPATEKPNSASKGKDFAAVMTFGSLGAFLGVGIATNS